MTKFIKRFGMCCYLHFENITLVFLLKVDIFWGTVRKSEEVIERV
jgi:hypothetical protein